MTIRRAKYIFAHHGQQSLSREKEGFSLSYFSAAMISLALAGFIAFMGYIALNDSVDGSLFDGPMVIVVPTPVQ